MLIWHIHIGESMLLTTKINSVIVFVAKSTMSSRGFVI